MLSLFNLWLVDWLGCFFPDQVALIIDYLIDFKRNYFSHGSILASSQLLATSSLQPVSWATLLSLKGDESNWSYWALVLIFLIIGLLDLLASLCLSLPSSLIILELMSFVLEVINLQSTVMTNQMFIHLLLQCCLLW